MGSVQMRKVLRSEMKSRECHRSITATSDVRLGDRLVKRRAEQVRRSDKTADPTFAGASHALTRGVDGGLRGSSGSRRVQCVAVSALVAFCASTEMSDTNARRVSDALAGCRL